MVSSSHGRKAGEREGEIAQRLLCKDPEPYMMTSAGFPMVLCPQRCYSHVLTHELTLKLPLYVARTHLFQTVGGQLPGLWNGQRFPGETSMRIKGVSSNIQ